MCRRRSSAFAECAECMPAHRGAAFDRTTAPLLTSTTSVGSDPHSMPRIAIGDCQLYYERHGAGFPVLFLSGLGGYGAFWRDQIPVFAKRFEVIVHDHRGIGQSDHSRISYTVDRMAGDVIELMDALGLERAHLVGHSTGGAIAQILAVEHPKRLASIVVTASWTKADAYFPRLFALRKEILVRLGPAAPLPSPTPFLYPP